MLVSYNWLKDYLGEDLPAVEKVVDLLTEHSFEVESTEVMGDDTVIDIKVLPDRAPDCLSHRGIARELATLINKPLSFDPIKASGVLSISDNFKITIANQVACSRFMLAKVDNIKVGPSPDWLVKRLSVIGQKSINNIVDATNFVMYAVGQPLHAYDADLFTKTSDNKWHFAIRQAKAGESLSLLKDKNSLEERKIILSGSELVIADGEKDLAIGLAGVKGGEYAGVSVNTKNIILEAAHFDATSVRQTARKHGIATDAVKRFENNPSKFLPPLALNNIIDLIKKIADGQLAGVFDMYPNPTKVTPVLVRTEKVNQVLGLSLESVEIKTILERLGATVEEVESGFLVTSPMERNDLLLEVNYIEEVGRIHGLSNIISIKPVSTILKSINANYFYSQKIRQILIDQGFSEVMTSSFRKQDEIQLQNALASDKEFLRSSLLPTLDEVLMQNAQNVDVLGLRDIRIFEIGNVFKKKEGRIEEKMMLAIGVQTKKTGHVPADDKIISTALETLQENGIVSGVVSSKGLCEIDLDTVIRDLPIPTKYEVIEIGKEVIYKPFSLYPAIVRDIALWVDASIKKEEVQIIIEDSVGPLWQRTTLFDEFPKDGRISYAFRLVFQSFDKTLTDAEVEPYMEAVYQAVKTAGFETR
ncbi:MAG: phenylalanine--tRNA ligase subunit beta [Candidatus Pacebacteria bacterium]|nr:phenylalanine--tRNA ligase subunit beta [Candidatus Paceibacterota bacterium]